MLGQKLTKTITKMIRITRISLVNTDIIIMLKISLSHNSPRNQLAVRQVANWLTRQQQFFYKSRKDHNYVVH